MNAMKVSQAELEETARVYSELKKQYSAQVPTTSKHPDDAAALPKFYEPVPADDDILQGKLREEARSLFLKRRSEELLSNKELKKIYSLLESSLTAPFNNDDKLIGYSDYKKVANLVPKKARPLLTAKLFGSLQCNDSYGRINISELFSYIVRKTWYRQTRIGLSLYDMTGQGYLTEKDLELYVTELIPSMPRLASMESSFRPFYLCSAVRRFMFHLDPMRLGRVRIVDIMASGFLDDFLELRDAGPKFSTISDSDVPIPYNKQTSSSSSARPPSSNWFDLDSTMKVYAQYLNLDEDRNGLLSRKELAKYGTATLTDVFLDRIFEECLTYDGEMDYKGYLDFVLAMENKADEASLHYFMRLLDIRARGHLDACAINYFFRAVQYMLDDHDQAWVEAEDVKDEIFDMVRPADPLKITVEDLYKSKHGATVVDILSDFNGFMTYENREALATGDDDDYSDEESEESEDGKD